MNQRIYLSKSQAKSDLGLVDFPRCSLLTDQVRYARRLRLEINQLTDGGMPPTYDSMR
jgi:hypothetical protein